MAMRPINPMIGMPLVPHPPWAPPVQRPPRDDHAFRRAQPYRRLRAYFGRVEQLAREGRIG